MNSAPIGIFDSGIGGLTVANALKKTLPNENIIYFGDTKHLPYGEKSTKVICTFCEEITKFLISKKCKAIVIACNSASSVGYNTVKKIAKKIPVFNAVEPVIENIQNKINNNIIGVIGTKATIQSKIYNKKIIEKFPSAKVFALATPLLAPMIEEGFINEDISQTVIKNYLSNEKLKSIDYLVLACTHYPLIFEEIKKYYNEKSVCVINSTEIIANYIAKELKNRLLLNDYQKAKYYFYVSNYTDSFEKSANFFFKEDVKLEEVQLTNL
tara:strand:- start:88 stop:894 length:807 start_codon:yes stop_codon:yes gene_type:complete